MPTPKNRKLSHRQNSFVEAYLANGGNATQAAKDAGYSEKSARDVGCENLTKPNILERIKERLNEAKVTSNEVIGTLAAQMRAKITDVLPDDGGLISRIKKNNLGHLIKKIKVRREIDPDNKKAYEVVELELYSAQLAAIQLAKITGIEQQPRINEYDEQRREVCIIAFMKLTGASRKEAEETIAAAWAAAKEVSDYVN